MRGSVTAVDEQQGTGCILTEDGYEFDFDKTSLRALDPQRLSVGDWVEFQEQWCADRPRPLRIKIVRILRNGHG